MAVGTRVYENNQQQAKENILDRYNDFDYILRMLLLHDENLRYVLDEHLLGVERAEPKNSVFAAR